MGPAWRCAAAPTSGQHPDFLGSSSDLSSPERKMVVLAEHLVGRTEELGSLDHALSELDRGRSAALELVGEPGIGKTRLLAELAARADDRGHLVLSGSASELERDLPFSVFVDALDEYVRGLSPG